MGLTGYEISILLLSLGILLAVARILGEVALRLNQSAVLGELLAGMLLGPTVLGAVAPEWNQLLFPAEGPRAVAMEGLSYLAVTLFLLVAGMELDLSSVWRQGRTVAFIGLAGLVVPFALSFAVAGTIPRVLGCDLDTNLLIFALFFATALSISALPVISKTLMDLKLYQTDLGTIVVAAAILNDVVGWVLFAVILGMMGLPSALGLSVGYTIALTLVYGGLMLTVGRWLINMVLPWITAHASWPGGILGFALSLCLLSAAFTEAVGVHAVFGSFLLGVAIGDSPHLRRHTRRVIGQFVSSVFAPLFFVGIGLRVNFATHFDLRLTLIVLVIATLGKVLGCGLGARAAGMVHREAWAVGFGMNARGAMEIILGLLALEFGLIGERLFEALVLMALATSILSGPMMQWLLKHKKPVRVADYLTPRAFVTHLRAATSREAIKELAQRLGAAIGMDPETIERAVWQREQVMSTGIGEGVAVPHARLAGVSAPIVGMGLSHGGVDFDAPDNELVHVAFLILTPENDYRTQLDVLADISRTFSDPRFIEGALKVANYTEFLALLRAGHAEA